jgi:heme exporter protein D
MEHAFYVNLSYGFSVLIVLVLIGWIWLDGMARRRELAELEASGIRRRSAAAPSQKASDA